MKEKFQKLLLWPLVALLLSSLPLVASALEAVRPAPMDRELALGVQLEILEDPDGELTIEQVAGAFSDRFTPSTKANPSFGFTRSTFWLRFSVDTSSVTGQRWYIVQRHPIIDRLTLYSPVAPDIWVPTQMGDALPFAERLLAHREFIFPLDTRRQGDQVYYLKVSGKGALSLELKLSSAEGLIERTYMEQLIFGLFYGALVVMLIYNLLLYFSVRDVAYFWYISFLASGILCFANINGLGLQYLWPRWPSLNEWYPIFATLAMVSLVQYTRAFLNLRVQFPRFERYLRKLLFVFLAGLGLVVLVPAPWSYHLSTLMVFVTVVSLTWIGFGTWRRGYRAARLYVIAWFLFLLGCMVFILDNTGVIGHSTLTNYSPHIGLGWVAVLLSLALGERIKILENERDALVRQNHEDLQRHFEEVQQLDRDKMVFLDYLSHELNTPLNWLAGARMLDSSKLPKEIEDAINMVHLGQDRLQQLVAISLRYFDLASRDQAPALSQVAPMWKLDRLLREPERGEVLEARSIRVLNRIPAELCVEACDRELGEVLSLLIDNAVQFSDDGSEIVATGEPEDDGQHVVICIADQGKGIDSEQLEGIFKPFFMVGSHHRADGFGLSLPMARVMIEQMGGRIWAQSGGRGQGARLCIRLRMQAP